MAEQEILLGSPIFSIPRQLIVKNCETFQDNPDLLTPPDRFRSAVDGESLRAFLAAIDGSPPELTGESVNELFCVAESSSLRRCSRRSRMPGRSKQLSPTKPASGFFALKSKASSPIERFVSCRRKFRIFRRRNRVSRGTTAGL
jgi:hypothetical protein